MLLTAKKRRLHMARTGKLAKKGNVCLPYLLLRSGCSKSFRVGKIRGQFLELTPQ